MDVASSMIEPNEKAFLGMLSEWNAMLEDIAIGLSSQWESERKLMEARQLELVSNGEWLVGPTDLLSIIGRARWETYHNAVLAWLMDPCGTHEFGAAFLSWVVSAKLGLGRLALSELLKAKTACEVARPRSRADIVVRMPSATIVFEVKVDHFERDDQCRDLVLDWQEAPGAHFVFVTPHGRKPLTAGELADRFTSLSFRDIRSCLDGFLRGGGSFEEYGPGIHAVATYQATLKVEFP